MKNWVNAAMIMAIFALGACDDGSLSGDTSALVSVQFADGVISRASGTTWSNDDRVGIYMLNAGTTTSYSYDGVTYSNIEYYNSSADGENATFDVVTSDEVIYYPMDNTASDFVAAYPYNAALTTANFLYPLSVSDQSDKAVIDLMTASIEDVYTTLNPLAFSFYHRLSQLQFVVASGESDPSLDGLTITIRGLVNSGTYNVMTDEIVLGGSATELTVLEQLAIVIPQASSSVVFHVATTDSPDGFDTEAVSVDFKTGEATTITLTLNRQGVLFEGSTIVNWADSDGLAIDAMQTPVAFSSVVDNVSTNESLYTSANGTIGVFMFDSTTTTIKEGAANIEYEADATGAFSVVTKSENIYYPEGDETVDFVAYAPYSTTKVGASDFTYEVDAAEQTDFLLAAKLDDKTITTASQSFTFSHMLSQIEVSVASGSNSPSLDGLEITISGLIQTGACVINAETPAVEVSTDAALDITVVESTPYIVVPQTSNNVIFKVTTTANTEGFTTSARSMTFSAGETTKVSLTLNDTDVNFSGVSTVTEWEDVSYNSGDTVGLF